MITEEIFELKYKDKKPITPFVIENFIKSKGLNPVRYAILEKKGNIYKIGVSGIKIPN